MIVGDHMERSIKELCGTISLVTTIISAVSIGMLGESLMIWVIYLVSAITGFINNVYYKNKKMTIVFLVFMVTNTMAIIRVSGGW